MSEKKGVLLPGFWIYTGWLQPLSMRNPKGPRRRVEEPVQDRDFSPVARFG